MRSRRYAIVAAAVAVLAGCGSSGSSSPASNEPGTTFGPSTVQIAQVTKIRDQTRCVTPDPGTGKYCGTDGGEYDLDPATLHDLGVLTAVTRSLGKKEYAVDVQLDKTSTEYLAKLTVELAPTHGKLAILADGKVITAAQVDVAIETGQFRVFVPKGQKVEDLARQIGG